jgi:hypothetical protein
MLAIYACSHQPLKGAPMSDLSPVVDITSLTGVESLFSKGVRDPWGLRLAGRLADFIVYSDSVRFTMPIWAGTGWSFDDDPTLPAILAQLRSRDNKLFAPLLYKISEKKTLSPDYLDAAFASFGDWAQNSKSNLHRWLELHTQDRIQHGHFAHARPVYVFDVGRLRGGPAVKKVASAVEVSGEDILYAFDVFLRYPLYGELAGPGSYFLAHPIRELPKLPTLDVKPGPVPNIALSLSDAVVGMAQSMTLDDYTSFLHEARGIIRDRKIHTLKPRSLDTDTIREIAILLGLPARLKAVGRTFAVGGGLISIAGAWPILGPAAAVVGGSVSVASALWTGAVGRSVSRMTWLRWALKWDVESQASDS